MKVFPTRRDNNKTDLGINVQGQKTLLVPLLQTVKLRAIELGHDKQLFRELKKMNVSVYFEENGIDSEKMNMENFYVDLLTIDHVI